MSKKYSLIVFDWDGTLMDSAARIVECLSLTITDLNLPMHKPSALRDIIGLGLPEAIRRLYPDVDDTMLTLFTQTYREHFLSGEKTPSRMFPGALSTLQQLSDEGYFLAVATGKGRGGLDRSIKEVDCADLFHITRCADECISKPHPQMLLEIMSVLDIPRESSLMIGDTEYDVLMAQQAGVDALGVDYGVHSRDRLMSHGALDCMSDICDVTAWLENH